MTAYTPPPPSTHYASATTDTNGMTLAQIKTLAQSVKPDDIDRMADLFDGGSDTMVLHQASLTMAVDNVVDGWKGQAADAASLSVYNTATKSRGTSERAVAASANMRSYADDVRQSQTQIDGVPTVDTSYSAALAKSGGPAAVMMNPGGPSANMAAANEQQAQNAKQASAHLQTMDDNGNSFAAIQRQSFQPIDPPSHGGSGGAPAPMSAETVSAQSFTPRYVASPALHPGGTSGARQAFEYTGTRRTGGVRDASGAGVDDCGDEDSTPGAQVSPDSSGHGVGGVRPTPEARPGTRAGTGGGPAAGDEAGAVAAGAAAGLPLGSAAGGRHAYGGPSEGESSAEAGAESGTGGGAGGEESAARGLGRGAGRGLSNGEQELERRGPRLRGDADFGAEGALDHEGLGRNALRPAGRGVGDLGDETELRANSFAAPGDHEFAAGEDAEGSRGALGAGGGRRRSDDDDELERRPDYLVEPDDLWGDGRLAAPPVLG